MQINSFDGQERSSVFAMACLTAATIGLSSLAMAAPVTLVNDTFEIGETVGATDGSRNNDAADPMDIPGYKVGHGGAVLGVEQQNRIGSPRSLQYSPYGSNRPAIGTLYNADLPVNSVTLGPEVGDFIKLSIRYRTRKLGALPNTFSFGLYNSNGTPTAVNLDTSSYDDYGYAARFAIDHDGSRDDAPDAVALAEIYKETGLDATATFGTDITTLTPVQSTGILVNSTSSRYVAELVLTRLSEGIGLDFYFYSLNVNNGSTTLIGGATGVVDTDNPYLTFDEIVFGTGAPGTGSDSAQTCIDDIQLVVSVVPEPGALAFLGASGLLLGARRRRSA